MQIKTFSSDDAAQLEHAANAWLAAHLDITIVHVAQSMGRTHANVDQVILTVFYTDVAVTAELARPATVATVATPLMTPVGTPAGTPDPPT